jgi:hypothetical protein
LTEDASEHGEFGGGGVGLFEELTEFCHAGASGVGLEEADFEEVGFKVL